MIMMGRVPSIEIVEFIYPRRGFIEIVHLLHDIESGLDLKNKSWYFCRACSNRKV
jgi:hypothetical protein